MTSAAGNPFNTLSLAQLRTRTSVKWATHGPDVLPLWVAEMDVLPDPVIANAVAQALAVGDTGYPASFTTHPKIELSQASSDYDYRTLPCYAHALADFSRERWGWDFKDTSSRPVSDVMYGIFHLVRTLANGGTVVVSDPVYPPFTAYSAYAGATVRAARLSAQGRLDFDELDRAFVGANVFILCNPQNPSGVPHTREELTQLLALANKHGVRIISDEVHAPLTSPAAARALGRDPFTPLLSLPGAERSFTVTSAAKGWNLAGFKAALIIAGDDAVADFDNMFAHAPDSASHLSVIAHTAAIMWARPWLDSIREGLDENRAYFETKLGQLIPTAKALPASATYLSWVDFSGVTTASGKSLGEDPAAFFLAEAKVAINSGPSFGSTGVQHARINIGTSHEVIDLALTQMAAALAQN
ncbi:aminotransferase class I/II-fold pyridoxal phosphate-dependent enzyme [Jonesiaceae bacterium BS-20]|uniref:cysteine-S-conjugate beta-lyase n=1 Tax=Jonesiaceae bacterium BS-20 TaxID=3120821 RepID=A0AAU7DVF8_9MICO